MFPGCRSLQLLRHTHAKGGCPGNGIRGFCNANSSFPRRPQPQSSAWKTVSGIASVVLGGLSEGREYLKSKGKQYNLLLVAAKYERDQKRQMGITLRRYVTLRALELELNKNKNRTKTYYFHLLEKVLSIMEDEICNDILDVALSQKFRSESKDIILSRANDEAKVGYLHSEWLTKSRDFANKRNVIQSGLIEALRHDSGAKFSEKDLVKMLSEKLLGGSALVEKLRPESDAESSGMNLLKIYLKKLRLEQEDTLQPPASMYASLCLVPGISVELAIPGPYGERDVIDVVVAYIHKRDAGPAGIPFEFDEEGYRLCKFISAMIFLPMFFPVMDSLRIREYLKKRHPNPRNM